MKHTRALSLMIGLVVALVASRARAQQAGDIAIVKDFSSVARSTAPRGFSEAREGVAWNGLLYFLAVPGGHLSDATAPWSLYATDGTPAGTRIISSVESHWSAVLTQSSARPRMQLCNFPTLGTRLVIATELGITLSDGTTEGTRQIYSGGVVSELITGSVPPFETPFRINQPAQLGDRLIFPIAPLSFRSLDVGTRDFVNLSTAQDGQRPLAVSTGTHVFWIALSSLRVTSDGLTTRTIANTSGVASGPFASGSLVYFFKSDGSLWRSDGTDAGTFLLTTNTGSPTGASIMAWDGLAFFRKPGTTGTSTLWVTDGTVASTRQVGGTLFPAVASTTVFRVAPGAGGTPARLYFLASQFTGSQPINIYSVDRGATQIVQHTTFPTALITPFDLMDDGVGNVYFRVSTMPQSNSLPVGLNVIDSTQPGGFRFVQDVEPASLPFVWFGRAFSRLLGPVGGRMVFYSINTTTGGEPWVIAPGNAASLLANIAPEATDGVTTQAPPIQAFGYQVIVQAATTPTNPSETNLWISDGAASSTNTSIIPGSSSGSTSTTPNLLDITTLDYSTRVAAVYSTSDANRTEIRLWNSASVAPAVLNPTIATNARPPLIGAHERLLFTSFDGVAGTSNMWATPLTIDAAQSLGTGLTATTGFVGGVQRQFDSSSLLVLSSNFAWLTGGTLETTQQTPVLGVDQAPILRAFPLQLTDSSSGENAFVLWAQPAAGQTSTRQFYRRGGPAGSDTQSAPTAASSRAVSATMCVVPRLARDGGGYDLWFATSVGTTQQNSTFHIASTTGDEPVLRLNIPAPASEMAFLQVGDARRLIFTLQDPASGTELWVSDFTQEGTMLLKDILPGPSGSYPARLQAAQTYRNDRAVFFADDGVHGRELWITDGTAEGTRMLGDLEPGPGGVLVRSKASSSNTSSRRGFEVTALRRDEILPPRGVFVASTLATGFELFSFPLPQTGCESIDWNGDGLFPSDEDILAYLFVYAGGACNTPWCGSIDFNNNGLFPEDEDLIAFLRVLSGGECRE